MVFTVPMLVVRTMKFSSFGNKTLFLCKQFLLFLSTNMATVKTIHTVGLAYYLPLTVLLH